MPFSCLLGLSLLGCFTTGQLADFSYEAAQAGNYGSAISNGQAAVAQDPRCAACWYWLAVGYKGNEQYKEAAHAFEKVIELEPSSEQLANSFASAGFIYAKYAKLEDFHKAIRYLRKAIDLSPKERSNPANWNNLGFALAEIGEDSEAIRCFETAISLAKTDYDKGVAYYRLGEVYRSEGRFRSAIRAFEQSSKLRGWTTEKATQELSKTRAAYTQRLEFARQMPRIKADRAEREAKHAVTGLDTVERRGILSQAVAAAEQAEANGKAREAFREYTRAWMVVYRDEDPAAWQRVHESIFRLYRTLGTEQPLPEAARRYAQQAQTHFDAGRFAPAIAAYTKALAISPQWPAGRFNIATLLAGERRYGEAIEEMRTYLRLAPDAPNARAAQDVIYKLEAEADGASREATDELHFPAGHLGMFVAPVKDAGNAPLGKNHGGGARVFAVAKDGPADKAGLREGDILLEVNGARTGSREDAVREVWLADPGSVCKLTVLRGGVKQSLTVVVGERHLDD